MSPVVTLVFALVGQQLVIVEGWKPQVVKAPKVRNASSTSNTLSAPVQKAVEVLVEAWRPWAALRVLPQWSHPQVVAGALALTPWKSCKPWGPWKKQEKWKPSLFGLYGAKNEGASARPQVCGAVQAVNRSKPEHMEKMERALVPRPGQELIVWSRPTRLSTRRLAQKPAPTRCDLVVWSKRKRLASRRLAGKHSRTNPMCPSKVKDLLPRRANAKLLRQLAALKAETAKLASDLFVEKLAKAQLVETVEKVASKAFQGSKPNRINNALLEVERRTTAMLSQKLNDEKSMTGRLSSELSAEKLVRAHLARRVRAKTEAASASAKILKELDVAKSKTSRLASELFVEKLAKAHLFEEVKGMKETIPLNARLRWQLDDLKTATLRLGVELHSEKVAKANLSTEMKSKSDALLRERADKVRLSSEVIAKQNETTHLQQVALANAKLLQELENMKSKTSRLASELYVEKLAKAQLSWEVKGRHDAVAEKTKLLQELDEQRSRTGKLVSELLVEKATKATLSEEVKTEKKAILVEKAAKAKHASKFEVEKLMILRLLRRLKNARLEKARLSLELIAEREAKQSAIANFTWESATKDYAVSANAKLWQDLDDEKSKTGRLASDLFLEKLAKAELTHAVRSLQETQPANRRFQRELDGLKSETTRLASALFVERVAKSTLSEEVSDKRNALMRERSAKAKLVLELEKKIKSQAVDQERQALPQGRVHETYERAPMSSSVDRLAKPNQSYGVKAVSDAALLNAKLLQELDAERSKSGRLASELYVEKLANSQLPVVANAKNEAEIAISRLSHELSQAKSRMERLTAQLFIETVARNALVQDVKFAESTHHIVEAIQPKRDSTVKLKVRRTDATPEKVAVAYAKPLLEEKFAEARKGKQTTLPRKAKLVQQPEGSEIHDTHQTSKFFIERIPKSTLTSAVSGKMATHEMRLTSKSDAENDSKLWFATNFLSSMLMFGLSVLAMYSKHASSLNTERSKVARLEQELQMRQGHVMQLEQEMMKAEDMAGVTDTVFPFTVQDEDSAQDRVRLVKIHCPSASQGDIQVEIIRNGCVVTIQRSDISPEESWSKRFQFRDSEGTYEFKEDQAMLENGYLQLAFRVYAPQRRSFRLPAPVALPSFEARELPQTLPLAFEEATTAQQAPPDTGAQVSLDSSVIFQAPEADAALQEVLDNISEVSSNDVSDEFEIVEAIGMSEL